MPEIHDTHASALFDLVDSDLIKEWHRFPEWKLAIIPFSVDIQSHEQLRNIKDHIFTAVTEITQSQSLGISAPEPNEKAKTIGHHPTTFLVYGLSEKTMPNPGAMPCVGLPRTNIPSRLNGPMPT